MKTGILLAAVVCLAGCATTPRPLAITKVYSIPECHGTRVDFSDGTWELVEPQMTVWAYTPPWPWLVDGQRYYSMVQAQKACPEGTEFLYDRGADRWSCQPVKP